MKALKVRTARSGSRRSRRLPALLTAAAVVAVHAGLSWGAVPVGARVVPQAASAGSPQLVAVSGAEARSSLFPGQFQVTDSANFMGAADQLVSDGRGGQLQLSGFFYGDSAAEVDVGQVRGDRTEFFPWTAVDQIGQSTVTRVLRINAGGREGAERWKITWGIGFDQGGRQIRIERSTLAGGLYLDQTVIAEGTTRPTPGGGWACTLRTPAGVAVLEMEGPPKGRPPTVYKLEPRLDFYKPANAAVVNLVGSPLPALVAMLAAPPPEAVS